VSAGSAEAAVVKTLNRFAGHVNRGEMGEALAHFTDSPSITEDIAPYHWRGPSAGQDWLAAMGANAERHGISGIHMGFGAPTMVEVTGDRGYAVLRGDLTFSFADAPDRRIQGHVTFVVQQSVRAWKIETLTWAWVSEG
jgi:hypothetical protein